MLAPFSFPSPLHVLHRQELLLWKCIIFKNRQPWAWEISREQTHASKEVNRGFLNPSSKGKEDDGSVLFATLPDLGSFFSPLILAGLLPDTSIWEEYLTPPYPGPSFNHGVRPEAAEPGIGSGC